MTTDPAHKPAKPAADEQRKIDKQIEDSFPASDPPSYAGGEHIVGEPPRRDAPVDKPSKNKSGPNQPV